MNPVLDGEHDINRTEARIPFHHADSLDVGIDTGDGRGDVGNDTFLVLEFEPELDGKILVYLGVPPNRHELFMLVSQFMNVIAGLCVDDDTPASADMTDNRVTWNRFTAFGVSDHQALSTHNCKRTLIVRRLDGVHGDQLPGDEVRHLVAEADGGPVGCLGITFEWSDWRNGLFWWIQSVYIDPSYRRQGVFGGLYAHVTELAKNATDVCGIRLYVEHDNTNAQQTYLSLGMVETHYKLLEVEF